LETFPQLSRFYFPKKQVLGYCGDYEVICDFDVSQRAVARAIFRVLGYAPIDEFLQVDRIGFDSALWDLVVGSEHCTVLDTPVAQVVFDPPADAFSHVRLTDDTVLRPSYVFDATNHGRLLGQTAKLAHRTLGSPQRVAHTHFHLAPNASGPPEPWESTTAIVRLFRESDGIEAIAWCIPLGSYVSVGLSMSATESDLPDAALLDCVATAFARHGVDYRRRYSNGAEVKGLRHSYFVYERAFGANWLLAGPSFCQVWWMASAGVGTALMAAQLAPRLLDDPARWGAEYDRYMHRLVAIQETFDYFALARREAYEPEKLHHFSDRFVINNLSRLAASARMRDNRLALAASPALEWLFSRTGAIRDYCSVQRVNSRMHAA
jgi:flavin-dependent dehydrogenase